MDPYQCNNCSYVFLCEFKVDRYERKAYEPSDELSERSWFFLREKKLIRGGYEFSEYLYCNVFSKEYVIAVEPEPPVNSLEKLRNPAATHHPEKYHIWNIAPDASTMPHRGGARQ
jgi:hypothetical protein